MNLQPRDPTGGEDGVSWEEIGVWQSFSNPMSNMSNGFLDIKDIVWPENALKPPDGVPEKRYLRVTFLEEDPYIFLGKYLPGAAPNLAE